MAGVDAFGTTWGFDVAGGVTYVNVADVTEIGLLDVSVETIDVSSHGSPSQWREYITGMKDGGELRMSVNYDPANHTAIWDAIGTDGVTHELVLPDAGAADVTFAGVITGFTATAPMDDKLSAEISLKITGPVTITP